MSVVFLMILHAFFDLQVNEAVREKSNNASSQENDIQLEILLFLILFRSSLGFFYFFFLQGKGGFSSTIYMYKSRNSVADW